MDSSSERADERLADPTVIRVRFITGVEFYLATAFQNGVWRVTSSSQANIPTPEGYDIWIMEAIQPSGYPFDHRWRLRNQLSQGCLTLRMDSGGNIGVFADGDDACRIETIGQPYHWYFRFLSPAADFPDAFEWISNVGSSSPQDAVVRTSRSTNTPWPGPDASEVEFLEAVSGRPLFTNRPVGLPAR
jgi:hypothetical protein